MNRLLPFITTINEWGWWSVIGGIAAIITIVVFINTICKFFGKFFFKKIKIVTIEYCFNQELNPIGKTVDWGGINITLENKSTKTFSIKNVMYINDRFELDIGNWDPPWILNPKEIKKLPMRKFTKLSTTINNLSEFISTYNMVGVLNQTTHACILKIKTTSKVICVKHGKMW